eukprot:1612713-Rhodomonas_salina.3
MRCPVLTYTRATRTVGGPRSANTTGILRGPYAMSGTDSAYAATRQRALCRLCRGSQVCTAEFNALRAILVQTVLETGCEDLISARRHRFAMSGTDIPCGAVCLRACYEVSGTDIAYGAIDLPPRQVAARYHPMRCPYCGLWPRRCPVLTAGNRYRTTCKECRGSQICVHNRQRSICKDCRGTIVLRTPYALPTGCSVLTNGTAASVLDTPYEMPGTDEGYGSMLHSPYEVSGTETGVSYASAT